MTTNDDSQQKGSRARIANFEKILANNPKSFIFAQLAEEHLKLQEYDKAIQICRDGLVHNPEFSDGLYVLGVAVFKKGDQEAAVRIFLRILNQQPDHYLAKEALQRMGHGEEWIQQNAAQALTPIVIGTTETQAAAPPKPAPVHHDSSEEQAAQARRSAPKEIRSALKSDAVLEEDMEDKNDDEGLPLWLKIGAAILLLLLAGGGYFGYTVMQKRAVQQQVALLYIDSRKLINHDTYTGYTQVRQSLEDSIKTYPKSQELKALLVETYSKLLIDFSSNDHNMQAHLEGLNATFPADSLGDSDLLTAQAYRSFYLGKNGNVRFLIDTAGEKGLLTPSLNCLDGELHLLDKDYDGSIRLFDETLNDDPALWRAVYKKAVAQFDRKDYSGARITLELLLEKAPDHQRGRILLWETKLYAGDDKQQIEKEVVPFAEKEGDKLPDMVKARLLFVQAVLLHAKGDVDEALKLASQSVELDLRAEPAFLLARLQYEKRMYTAAKLQVLKAIDLNRDVKKYHAFLGRLYFMEDNKTAALEEMELAIDDATDELDLLVMAADAAFKLRMYDRAVQYYERATFVNFQNLDLKKKLILTYIEKQDMKDAKGRIEKIMQDHPDDPLSYFLNGRYLLAEGSKAKAEKEFKKGLQLDPNNREILLEMANLNIRRGKIDAGILSLRRLEKLNPDDSEVLQRLARYSFAANSRKEAYTYYKQLSDMNPQLALYRLRLAYLDYMSGNKSQAKQVVEAELAKDPNLGYGHILRGIFLFLEGDGKTGEAQIQRGIQLDSKNPEGHYWLARIKLDNKDYTWAKNELDIALECEPVSPKVYYEIGMIYFNRSQFKQARDLFDKAAQIFRLFPLAVDYRVRILLRLGEIEIFRNRLREGMRLVEEASKLDPEAGEPYYIMARDGSKFANPRKAISLLNKALKLNPDLHAAHYELGLVYMAKDNKKKAIEEFRLYLKLDPKGRYAADAKRQLNELGAP